MNREQSTGGAGVVPARSPLGCIGEGTGAKTGAAWRAGLSHNPFAISLTLPITSSTSTLVSHALL